MLSALVQSNAISSSGARVTLDPQVDLIFSHFIPRYEATGVDPNDLRELMRRIYTWSDWCRLWSEEGARHEKLADEARASRFRLTAAEAYVRAAMYYHYGKHLFAERADEFQSAHQAMLRCYETGASMFRSANSACRNSLQRFKDRRVAGTAA